MRCIQSKSKFAITLIELLIVVMLIGILSLVAYATFSSGVRIWQRFNQPIPEEDVNIFFDRLNSDLRNSFRFKDIAFVGRQDRFEFPTLVTSPRLGYKSVGKVIYVYNTDSEALIREQKDFSHIYTQEEGVIQTMLRNVNYFKVQYYFFDLQKRRYLWQEDWPKDDLPLAVRVEFQLNYADKTYRFKRTFDIPASS
ncbi:MAG: prepilin-type N-terminal cleavage/methylation domain-containing protein [Candidatus Omnitrophica bacterium]|nr:prepilin-type N-terminal cleavage/methylation domain-containing protein [Candidatus Omnitrophota bacterium]